MSLRFLEEASDELITALRGYSEKDVRLGAELAAAVDERLARAVEMPGAGRREQRAPARFDLRWYRLRRFPYALLIGNLRGERVVVAVAHERRRPGYWRERLP